MNLRRPAAVAAGATALLALGFGVDNLLERFEPGCGGPCTVVTTYRGTLLVLAGLFAAALSVLAWPARPASSP